MAAWPRSSKNRHTSAASAGCMGECLMTRPSPVSTTVAPPTNTAGPWCPTASMMARLSVQFRPVQKHARYPAATTPRTAAAVRGDTSPRGFSSVPSRSIAISRGRLAFTGRTIAGRGCQSSGERPV